VSEIVAAARSKGEVLVFKRGALREQQKSAIVADEEHQVPPGRRGDLEKKEAVQANVEKQTSILHWQDVSYTVKTGGGERLILDHVDGWVKPGTLTALMGVSGVRGYL
jgi:ABC-type glutathione transport system ATPase component